VKSTSAKSTLTALIIERLTAFFIIHKEACEAKERSAIARRFLVIPTEVKRLKTQAPQRLAFKQRFPSII
jgi:hypothetical protein